MEIGLSHETVEMIEQHLGPRWARRALWGVTFTMILAPFIASVTLAALAVGLLFGIWAWAVNQVSDIAGVAIGVSLVTAVIGVLLFHALLTLFRPRAERILAESKQVTAEAGKMLAESRQMTEKAEAIHLETQQIREVVMNALAEHREETPPQ